ncbi:MAG TPA: hypothetical protein VEV19_05490 [Ktedonobacteraceae bacterium]|nr:hypothetical protein [Ktedonobacteraceae bacterium]
MSKKQIDISPPIEPTIEGRPLWSPLHLRRLALCAAGLLLCILISVAPLLHLAGKTFLLPLPTNPFLLAWGSWLPYDLHFALPKRASMISTNTIEFLLLVAISFGIYALASLLIQKQPERQQFTAVTRLIWFLAIAGGIIYILTPAMISRDIFVYVGYGRTISLHHANPYFVAPSAFPQDPLTIYDDWQSATAAYGPLWLVICALLAPLGGNSPLAYLLIFRLLSFASYLFNIWLISNILKNMGRSPRTVTLGTLLYAWNPLVIEETCLGGHNDTIMVTLLLLGIWFSVRAEQQDFARPSRYLLPAIAFTLATLVKITALPLIVLYLVFLARRAMSSAPSTSSMLRLEHIRALNWQAALAKVVLTGAVCGIIAALFYAPFWLGHSIQDILTSFSSPPSSILSENSIMRAIHEWILAHGLPSQNSWAATLLTFFNLRVVWDRISYVCLAATLIVGAVWIWRVPTTRTMLLAALLSLGGLLLVTPWFFAWYIIWLVSIAALCLPAIDRLGRALLAFTLTFSATAFITYGATVSKWQEYDWLAMGIPPLIAFFFFLYLKKRPSTRLLSDTEKIDYDIQDT